MAYFSTKCRGYLLTYYYYYVIFKVGNSALYPMKRRPQTGDYILITFGTPPLIPSLSFFYMSGSGEYQGVYPHHQPDALSHCESEEDALRLIQILKYVLGAELTRVDGWSPKPPPNFIPDNTLVFRIDSTAE